MGEEAVEGEQVPTSLRACRKKLKIHLSWLETLPLPPAAQQVLVEVEKKRWPIVALDPSVGCAAHGPVWQAVQELLLSSPQLFEPSFESGFQLGLVVSYARPPAPPPPPPAPATPCPCSTRSCATPPPGSPHPSPPCCSLSLKKCIQAM